MAEPESLHHIDKGHTIKREEEEVGGDINPNTGSVTRMGTDQTETKKPIEQL